MPSVKSVFISTRWPFVATRMNVPTFYVSFFFSPFIAYLRDFNDYRVFAKRQTIRVNTSSIALVQGMMIINNIMNIGLFLGTVYFRYVLMMWLWWIGIWIGITQVRWLACSLQKSLVHFCPFSRWKERCIYFYSLMVWNDLDCLMFSSFSFWSRSTPSIILRKCNIINSLCWGSELKLIGSFLSHSTICLFKLITLTEKHNHL